ncbi:unnamed protein product [marine sediment metagenome]|uniref:Uncharacterized protein n=1 Tax=marine sediment metagenome TaxID=412755 RepID=X1VN79_9ZZZZ
MGLILKKILYFASRTCILNSLGLKSRVKKNKITKSEIASPILVPLVKYPNIPKAKENII